MKINVDVFEALEGLKKEYLIRIGLTEDARQNGDEWEELRCYSGHMVYEYEREIKPIERKCKK